MSDVRLVLLNNGLQLVTEVKDTDVEKGRVTLVKPVQLIIGPRSEEDAQQGKVGMMFTPFMQYTEEWSVGMVLSATDVLAILTPNTDILNNYRSHFGSGIVLPGGGTQGGLVLPGGR